MRADLIVDAKFDRDFVQHVAGVVDEQMALLVEVHDADGGKKVVKIVGSLEKVTICPHARHLVRLVETSDQRGRDNRIRRISEVLGVYFVL